MDCLPVAKNTLNPRHPTADRAQFYDKAQRPCSKIIANFDNPNSSEAIAADKYVKSNNAKISVALSKDGVKHTDSFDISG